MQLKVDAHNPLPLYAQLERSLRAAIARGELAEGEQLPTVRQLAVDLRVNANTVARVYAELEREGVLATQRGVGTFVLRAAPVKRSAGQRAAAILRPWISCSRMVPIQNGAIATDRRHCIIPRKPQKCACWWRTVPTSTPCRHRPHPPAILDR